MADARRKARGQLPPGAAVRAQDGGLRQDGLQGGADVGARGGWQDEVGGGAATVAGDEHRNLLPGGAALAGLAAPAAGLASQPSLPLGRTEEVGLIGLGDTGELPGLDALGHGQEAVAPAEGRALGDVEPIGDMVEGQSIAQGGGMPQPLAALTQTGERGAGQGVEGFEAAPALEPLQPVGRAVLDHLAAGALWADRPRRHPALDHLGRGGPRLQRRQFGGQRLVQAARQLIQDTLQSHQFAVPHRAHLTSEPMRHDTSMESKGLRT